MGGRRLKRVSAIGASLALVMGLLAGLVSALVGSTAAYAGSTTTSYSCKAPVVGLETVGATITETPNQTASLQVGQTFTETQTLSATIPGSLLDTAYSAGQTQIAMTAATLTVDGTNVTPASQQVVAAAGQLPIIIPIPLSTGNAGATVSVTMNPDTWTAGPGTGTATLTPGELDLTALLSFPCYTPGAQAAAIGGPSSPAATPMDSFSVTPVVPLAPVVQDQTANVAAGQCVTVNTLHGATAVDNTITASTLQTTPATATADGTLTNNGDGTVTYCNKTGTAATDSFTFTVNSSANLLSNVGTVTINISYNQCSAGTGNLTGGSTGSLTPCSLHQEILLPVEPGQIILSQASGLPLDVLGSSFCTGGSTPGITLNGNSQAACGRISPVTVTNATGLDTGWALTGQVTDFVDPGTPTLTCDTVATYNNHCIPGGNLSWEPAGAVAHNIVPGDTAQVTPGAIVAPFVPVAPAASTNPILAPAPVQPNPVVEVAPNAGLHNAPQTMCSTQSGASGGTFVCGAGLELIIPASIAEPIVSGAIGAPAYQATITLTLS